MKYMVNRFGLKCVVMLSMGLGAWTSGEAQRILWRSEHFDAFVWAYPSDMSSDGQFVLGRVMESYEGYSWHSNFLWDTTVQQVYLYSSASARDWNPAARGTGGITPNGRFIASSRVDSSGQERPLWLDRQRNVARTAQDVLGYATDISADGRYVVGVSSGVGYRRNGFFWDVETNVMRILEPPQGYHDLLPFAISADGQRVVGAVRSWGNISHAFLWDSHTGQMQYLATSSGGQGEAYNISPNGRYVVGWSLNQNRQRRAFRIDLQTGQILDIGVLPGFSESVAYAISADGRFVVGSSSRGSAADRAFIWDATTGIVEDLNFRYSHLLAFGEELYGASVISEDGRFIAGWGYNGVPYIESYWIDTVPEPASLIGLCSGIIWLLSWRRYKHS